MLFRTLGKLSITAKIFEKYIDRSTWRELSALRNYLTARQKKNAKKLRFVRGSFHENLLTQYFFCSFLLS